MTPIMTAFTQEWQLLQQASDRYESYSLVIKLVALLIAATGLLLAPAAHLPLAGLLLIAWLLDGIWKTFQSRTEARLLLVETAIAESPTEPAIAAFQLNRDFARQRPSGLSLLASYLKQALRPTVALGHCLLLSLVGLMAWLG